MVLLGLAFVLASCTPLRIQLPLTESDSDWMTDGGTGRRDRRAVDDLVNLPLEQAWIYNASAGFSSGSALIVADLVFVGTRKGEVHVVDLFTGDKIGMEEFGHSIEGAPAIIGQTLFVPNSWGKNSLVAFDLFQGARLWEYRGVPIEASLLAVGESIVVGDVEGNVMAFDATTGTTLWVYEFGEIATIFTGPTLINDEQIVVVNEAGDVACLNVDDGSEVWVKALGASVQESVATDQDHVYIPSVSGVFFALDHKTGEVDWEFRLENAEIRFAGAAVSPDLVVFGGSDGVLRGLDPKSGSAKWTFQTDGTFAAPPAISGELVFVGAMDREFFAVSAHDGSMQWSTTLRGRIKSSPAVRKGFVVVMSEPRYVYAFANADAIAAL
jgi:outer membrane protein assembly factor BamB